MLTMTSIPSTATTFFTTDSDMIAIKDSTSRTSGLKLKGNKPTMEQVDSAASEFEAQFASQMLSKMFDTVDPHESLGGSDSEEVYQSMLVNEYGKILAKTGGLGIADQVKQAMLKQQEVE